MFSRLVAESVNMVVNANVGPPRSTKTSPGSSPREGRVPCDQCRCVIRGIRYMCLNCPNFDLCEHCVDNCNGKFIHAVGFEDKHPFRAIAPKSSDNGPPTRTKERSRGEVVGSASSFVCDMCTQAITDVRYHCVICSDSDTCGDCFQNSPNEHCFLHIFAEIGRKGMESKSSKEHGKSNSLKAPSQDGDHSPSTRTKEHSRGEGEPVVPSAVKLATRRTTSDALPTGRALSTRAGMETRSRKAAGLHAAGIVARELAGGAVRATNGGDGAQGQSPAHPVGVTSGDSQDYVLADSNAPPLDATPVTGNTGKLPGLPGPPPVLPVPFTENQVYKTPDPFPHTLTHIPSSETPFATETKIQIQPVPTFSHHVRVQAKNNHKVTTKPPSAARSFSTHLAPAASRSFTSARLISDSTVPDGRVLLPGDYFQKSWRLRNDGAASWPAGTGLAFVEGDRLGALDPLYKVPHGVHPGEVVDVTILFRAPEVPGSHVSSWKLKHHEFFGDLLQCNIVIKQSDPAF